MSRSLPYTIGINSPPFSDVKLAPTIPIKPAKHSNGRMWACDRDGSKEKMHKENSIRKFHEPSGIIINPIIYQENYYCSVPFVPLCSHPYNLSSSGEPTGILYAQATCPVGPIYRGPFDKDLMH